MPQIRQFFFPLDSGLNDMVGYNGPTASVLSGTDVVFRRIEITHPNRSAYFACVNSLDLSGFGAPSTGRWYNISTDECNPDALPTN